MHGVEETMDVAALLASRGDDAPSGENLEYDMDFISLELAAAPGEERQAGDEILPADDPDWADVRDKALVVLERSHDLRAACYLAPALLATEGLTGLAEAIAYIRGCVEDYWDTCHPQLDADDDNDPTMRVNAVQNLSTPVGGQSSEPPVLRLLRQAPLSESRAFGRFGLRDIQSANGEVPPPKGADAPDPGAIAAAFQDSDPAILAERLAAARQVLADVKAIDARFNSEIPGRGPNFDAMLKMLQQVVKQLADHAPGNAAAAEDAADDVPAAPSGGSTGAVARPSGGGGGTGSIAGSRDVIAALDRILAYYEANEPSSPLPIILKRAKRLVGADFITIMKDLAPQGMESVTMIGGEEE
jgi:type VI secretion system protein ImpA